MNSKPNNVTGRDSAESSSHVSGPRNKSRGEELDPGLALLVDLLKRKRKRLKMSVTRLAKRAHVSAVAIQKLEAYHLNSVGLQDLLAIGTALGSKLTVGLAPVRPKLPKTNPEILREFDTLIKSPNCNPFVRNQPDNEHRDLRWDIVGDTRRNWLLVVVSHRKRKVRFAKVTDEPGGWAIGGQMFGIDAETNAIAQGLSEQLFNEHRAELLAPPSPQTRGRDGHRAMPSSSMSK